MLDNICRDTELFRALFTRNSLYWNTMRKKKAKMSEPQYRYSNYWKQEYDLELEPKNFQYFFHWSDILQWTVFWCLSLGVIRAVLFLSFILQLMNKMNLFVSFKKKFPSQFTGEHFCDWNHGSFKLLNIFTQEKKNYDFINSHQ